MILKRNLSFLNNSIYNPKLKNKKLEKGGGSRSILPVGQFREKNNQSKKVFTQLSELKHRNLPTVFNYQKDDSLQLFKRSLSVNCRSRAFRIKKPDEKLDLSGVKKNLPYKSILTNIIEKNKRNRFKKPNLDKMRALIISSQKARERAQNKWRSQEGSYRQVESLHVPASNSVIKKIRIRIRKTNVTTFVSN
mmetsp:Transcript_32600/g.28861  ORF Transcript_32600/g.28861 Transcript_32600/m.28861 type:complete len:192 (-) Transcript_32600:106-681(-)